MLEVAYTAFFRSAAKCPENISQFLCVWRVVALRIWKIKCRSVKCWGGGDQWSSSIKKSRFTFSSLHLRYRIFLLLCISNRIFFGFLLVQLLVYLLSKSLLKANEHRSFWCFTEW